MSHKEELYQRKDELLLSWTIKDACTYLWHYIYEQIKDFKDSKHEVVIITDGIDDRSPVPFKGLLGFNELLTRMHGGKVRISLYLIGNSLSAADAKRYRDLCLASGGFFHQSPDSALSGASALEDLIGPLLLPEGERDKLARHQQMAYQQMLLNGEAQRFEWYLPLTNGEPSSASAGGSGSRLPLRPTLRNGGSASALPVLSPSARVKISGLQNAVELNGKEGTCEAWLADKGRWQVKFDNGEVRALLSKNMQVLACAGAAGSRHSCVEL